MPSLPRKVAAAVAPAAGVTREELREELRAFAEEITGKVVSRLRTDSLNPLVLPPGAMQRQGSLDLDGALSMTLTGTASGELKRMSSHALREIEEDMTLSPVNKAKKKLSRLTTRLPTIANPSKESSVVVEFSRQTQAYDPLVEVGGSARNSCQPDLLAWRDYAKLLLCHPAFEPCIAFVVILNAASLGYATDFWALHRGHPENDVTIALERLFCCIFTVEWLFRVYAFGMDYLRGEDLLWNLLDTFLVWVQIAEQILAFVAETAAGAESKNGIVRLMGYLRIFRITRLLRTLRFSDDLRRLVSSISRSFPTLCWSIVLLSIMMYSFAIIIMQAILGAESTVDDKTVQYWYADVTRTFLTLFESIVGGVSWDEVIWPLILDVDPVLGVWYCWYVAFSYLAIMNLMTGVFVDEAMRVVREDKDGVLAKRIAELFMKGTESQSSVTWEAFHAKLETKPMQDFFKQINVDKDDARSLFDLLDADGNGGIDSREFVEGCLRLRGPARALELEMLTKKVSKLLVCQQRDT